jgi:hypothetical protein
MTSFTETGHCLCHAHCCTCRDKEGGRAWREALGKAFELPPGAPDFACPHGLEWGATPERVAAARVPEPAYVAGRRAACDACDVPAEECGVKMQREKKPCWFGGYVRRAGSVCPKGLWLN